MTESAVDITGVEKRFGDLVAVRDLDLRIERGEFFSIIGPSGCGKTTTLRMIAGFEEPTAGQVLLDGRDISRTSRATCRETADSGSSSRVPSTRSTAARRA